MVTKVVVAQVFRFFPQYIWNLLRRWYLVVVVLLELSDVLEPVIPSLSMALKILRIPVYILVFVFANYLVYAEIKREYEDLKKQIDQELLLTVFQNKILETLREMTPDIGYSQRPELNQIVLDIVSYWRDSNQQLFSENIGHIDLFIDSGRLKFKCRPNEFSKATSPIKITEVCKKITQAMNKFDMVTPKTKDTSG